MYAYDGSEMESEKGRGGRKRWRLKDEGETGMDVS